MDILKIIIEYILINFLDLESIKNIILTVKIFGIFNDKYKTFLEYCRKGFEVAKWLYSLGNTDILPYDEHKLKNELAKWLYSSDDIDILPYDGYGHRDVAKWLYLLDNINMKKCDGTT